MRKSSICTMLRGSKFCFVWGSRGCMVNSIVSKQTRRSEVPRDFLDNNNKGQGGDREEKDLYGLYKGKRQGRRMLWGWGMDVLSEVVV